MTHNSYPYIICFMESSIDGRLRMDRYSKLFHKIPENFEINEYMKIGVGEMKGDAMLLGSSTYYTDFCQKLYDIDSHKVPASNFEPFKGKRNSKSIYTVIMDSKGVSIYDENLTKDTDYIAILSEKVSDDYLKYLRDSNVSYVFAGSDGRDIEKALNTLYSMFEIKTILLAGGGILNGIFLKKKLIDEIALFISPSIDGKSGQPSIFECPGDKDDLPAQGQTLEFIDSKNLEYGYLFTRYKVHK